MNSWGVEVVAKESSADALAVLNTDEGPQFDFALLDDQMPGMDGIELAKRIRNDSRLTAMRLIMLTTRDHYESNSETVQLFAAILTKPLRRSQLLNCVTRAMTAAPEAGTWRRPPYARRCRPRLHAPSCQRFCWSRTIQ